MTFIKNENIFKSSFFKLGLIKNIKNKFLKTPPIIKIGDSHNLNVFICKVGPNERVMKELKVWFNWGKFRKKEKALI